jgi:hypothetical protein
MNRLPLEVADIIRSAGKSLRERSRRWITWQHHKVLDAILRCRTAVLGGHRFPREGCFRLARHSPGTRDAQSLHSKGKAKRDWY